MLYKLAKPDYGELVVGAGATVPLADGRLVPEINFDNAATTPPLRSVIEQLVDFAPLYSSVHRGTGYKSQVSSVLYEEARSEVLKFVSGDPGHDTVIFVKNTTEAINLLANRLRNQDKTVVITTYMEHHSNLLPWQKNFHLVSADIDETGKLVLSDLEAKLARYRGKVRLVAVTGASNVTGYVNPIHAIAELAHHYGAEILVDGAQLVPHLPVDVKPPSSPRHIDYLAFSAHKLYAPFGTGVLIGPYATFAAGSPTYVGGGTVRLVTPEKVVWDDPPHKDEAGTPNLMGVVALVAALKTLARLGLKNLARHENSLTAYAINQLRRIPGLQLFVDHAAPGPRIGVIPFNLADLHHTTVAQLLASEAGIAVRSGCFCAQPYVQRLLKVSKREIEYAKQHPNALRPGLVRLSFGFYNDFSEIDVLTRYLGQLAGGRKARPTVKRTGPA